ncbi:MAG TPA: VWA domain-containing protein [Vicinamibacterales bacterium]|nr:VWA domain-containing protein [Vicinamibacterales bacterium]
MRRLLRGRHGARVVALAAIALAWFAAAPSAAGPAEERASSIHITSPTGRSGLPGRVRIVARVTTVSVVPPSVRFYVGDQLLATDTDGAPYAVEWTDENPFEARRIRVEMTDGETVVEAHVDLKPFEVVEATEVLSVNVDASVRDAKGRYAANLSGGDFRMFENGTAQKIDAVLSEAMPTTFALLVDSSQSMARNMDFVRQSVLRLPGLLRETDAAIVAPFRDTVTTVTGPTRDAGTLADAVAAIKSGGGTAILESLSAVAARFGDAPHRRAVVLVTDGYDELSTISVDEVVAQLKDAKIIVYSIAVGGVSGVSVKGERMLRFIAEQTGGRAFFPWTPKEMAEACATIASDAQHRYVVTYTPSNQRHDGAWRAIRLEAVDPAYSVVARDGYLSPEPKPVKASFEFTVLNGSRQYVDISPENLQVLEDGVPQKVESFHESVAPVSVMLALDASGSMTKVSPAVMEAAHAFVSALKPEDPLGIELFADRAEMAHDLSPARWVSHRNIQRYVARGGTALYDGLVDSMVRLGTVPGRRVVVVMTDGRDENATSTGPGSTRTWDDVLATARTTGATVYAIGFGTNVDVARLEQLTSLTGGEAYFTNNVGELGAHYQRIVDDLHRRFVLAYTSTNSERNGEWRAVGIKATDPALKVRSPGGYFAPAQ